MGDPSSPLRIHQTNPPGAGNLNRRRIRIRASNTLISAILVALALSSALLSLILLPTLLHVTTHSLPMEPLKSNEWEHANENTIDDSRSCFHARPSSQLQSDGHRANYSLPILNLGFPKGGSTSLQSYFSCGGLDTSHFKCRKRDLNQPDNNPNATRWITKGVQCGKCIRHTLEQNLPIPALDRCGSYQVYTQLDVENDWNRGGCFFPQSQALDILHEQNPRATFILTFRPIHKWLSSLQHWKGFDKSMMERLSSCAVANVLPGLEGKARRHFADWWCHHVEYVRDFVRQHPSHTLVEVEVESDDAGRLMEAHFGIDKTCWGHTNRNILKSALSQGSSEGLKDMKLHKDMPVWMHKEVAKHRSQT